MKNALSVTGFKRIIQFIPWSWKGAELVEKFRTFLLTSLFFDELLLNQLARTAESLRRKLIFNLLEIFHNYQRSDDLLIFKLTFVLWSNISPSEAVSAAFYWLCLRPKYTDRNVLRTDFTKCIQNPSSEIEIKKSPQCFQIVYNTRKEFQCINFSVWLWFKIPHGNEGPLQAARYRGFANDVKNM